MQTFALTQQGKFIAFVLAFAALWYFAKSPYKAFAIMLMLTVAYAVITDPHKSNTAPVTETDKTTSCWAQYQMTCQELWAWQRAVEAQRAKMQAEGAR